MNYDLKVGFGRIDITPPLGIDLLGYYHRRLADGVLDNLEANALAIRKNDVTTLLVAIDNACPAKYFMDECKSRIKLSTGVKESNIYIHATHTHTGPKVASKMDSDKQYLTSQEELYEQVLICKIADACKLAIDDLAPAKLGYGKGKAERVAFNRRYLMKDGTTQTNPGVNNPNIEKAIGVVDEEVSVLRFLREDGKSYVLGEFGNHPDVVGGNKISGDWPTLTRSVFEKAIENSKCIFFNGPQGDLNHVNVFPEKGDMNGMFIDFDNVSRGYSHAKHIANVVASGMMNAFEKVNFIDVDEIKCIQKTIEVKSNMPLPEEMEQAYYIQKMHKEGKDSELPYKGMMLTTMVADSARKIKLEHGPETFPLLMSGLKLGKVAIVGFPGEPFCKIGVETKKYDGFDMVIPFCLTNECAGYFPMQDSYDEGGYESKTSSFKAGVGERLIEEAHKLLDELK